MIYHLSPYVYKLGPNQSKRLFDLFQCIFKKHMLPLVKKNITSKINIATCPAKITSTTSCWWFFLCLELSHVLSRRTIHFRVASKNGLKEHAINMPFPTFSIFTYYDMIHIHINICIGCLVNFLQIYPEMMFLILWLLVDHKTVGIKDLLRRLTAHREMHEDYCAHSGSLRFQSYRYGCFLKWWYPQIIHF